MLIPVIGSVYNAMKMTELNLKWQEQKENPNMLKKEEEDSQIVQLKEDLERIRKGNMISSLDSKLRSGGELTDKELEYLKSNNPELYQEALDIKRERQAYKKALKNCRTKEDVGRLYAHKTQVFASKTQANHNSQYVGQNSPGQVLLRTMGIQNEHLKFISSKEYDALPREKEMQDKDRKRNI